MTREEAIKIIDCYDIGFYDLSGEKIPADKLADAFDMAIEALKAKTDGDLISRQDAIEALTDFIWVDYSTRELAQESAEMVMGQVPSAEPKTGKWVLDPNGMDWNIPAWRCSECGFVANYIGVEANGLGNNPMNLAGSKYCPECGCKIVGARMRGEEE